MPALVDELHVTLRLQAHSHLALLYETVIVAELAGAHFDERSGLLISISMLFEVFQNGQITLIA